MSENPPSGAPQGENQAPPIVPAPAPPAAAEPAAAAPPAPPAPVQQAAPVPPVPPVPPVQPMYGQYAPPQTPPGPHAPPALPAYGQYAPPPPFGQPASPPPAYGQYAPPAYGSPPASGAPPVYGAPPIYGQPAYGQPAYGQAAQPAAPQPGQQWAPPPKPGLVPLRPLGFGTLLGSPFQVLRRNTGPTVGSALIIQFIIYLVTGVIIGGAVLLAVTRINQASASDQDAIAAGSTVIILLSTIIPLAVGLVASALLQGILVIEVSREVLGEKRRLGELWRAAGKRVWPLLLWTLLEGAAIVVVLVVVIGVIVLLASLGTVGIVLSVVVGIVGFFGLLALAVWLGTKFALVPCAIVLERMTVRQAMVRSWRLTSRSFWKTFGVLILVNVIMYFAAQLVSTPVAFLLSLGFNLVDPNGASTSTGTSTAGLSSAELTNFVVTYLVLGVVQLVVGAITAVVQAAAVSLVYIDLRIRKEGLDLELIRFVEARQAGLAAANDDPFLVTGRQ
ncbi:glycerophosphoryl diester phosphodiesterase membrane domain-containing protein [Subtercola sp. PAMC28395]|uniref:glycerophosphoryl diester phosphodiesterase membrane domain-containing protein n=1 Tax=Subtercola sp. PAMC28395 TaxID=2846775 RepID=UPI001C0E1DC5|nr:glycerophosphoryl diester phosphodiesterase membrane domain-containing protein [Subtercola sp. PAMC28395]QWT25060.1 glycerophosphoryl diester phosphodiesterase membrane domain-containing protein [Subtercola sp. PAMC28395]